MKHKPVFIQPELPSFLAETPSRESAFIEFRIHRQWVVAILLSLLLHAILLLSSFLQAMPPIAASQNATQISVRLAPIAKNESPLASKPAESNIKPEATPTPKPRQIIKKSPAIIATERSKSLVQVQPATPTVIPSPTAPLSTTIPAPKPPTPTDNAPITDMQSYVNAAKARRRAAGDAGLENEAAIEKQRAPTADEIKSAIIARNLQSAGQNGLFTILSKDEQYARLSFRGWTNDPNNARNEIIDVDAGSGGNIERAIVKRVIEIIRKHYKEDFNWHSQRFDKVIVLSARPEDTAGLEDFLMRELFGKQNGLPVQY